MRDVFISYKSDEYADAIWLAQVLEKNGVSCWIAPESIPGGSNYGQEIPKAIEGCKIFVLVLSHKAQESMWVSKEVNMALNYKKTIMPFMIEDCELMKEFNFYLSDVQRYAAYESKVNAVGQMLSEIKGILGEKAESFSIPTERESKKRVPAKEKAKIEKKPKQNYSVLMLIFLAYLLCIPGGIVTTISYMMERMAKKETAVYKVTKILCILAIMVGTVFFTAATVRYSHCNEAYYISVPGIIIEILHNM